MIEMWFLSTSEDTMTVAARDETTALCLDVGNVAALQVRENWDAWMEFVESFFQAQETG